MARVCALPCPGCTLNDRLDTLVNCPARVLETGAAPCPPFVDAVGWGDAAALAHGALPGGLPMPLHSKPRVPGR
jgi:hypothetical protein